MTFESLPEKGPGHDDLERITDEFETVDNDLSQAQHRIDGASNPFTRFFANTRLRCIENKKSRLEGRADIVERGIIGRG